MSEHAADQARRVLFALADLSPSAEQSAGGFVVPTDWFRWLSASSVRIFHHSLTSPGAHAIDSDPLSMHSADIDGRFADRLAAIDRLRGRGTSLRIGWLWVAGRLKDDKGHRRRVFHPLITLPVVVHDELGTRATLRAAGDLDVTPLVEDRSERERLERNLVTGGGALEGINIPTVPDELLRRLTALHTYARSVARAAGLPATTIEAAREGPDHLLRRDDLSIVVGVAVYSRIDAGTSSRAASLREWANGDLRWPTAFHSMYTDATSDEPVGTEPKPDIESPYLLTPTQREAVRSSTHRPVTLVSGPPGTGKSHTIAAIALDALARGEDVLVAAKVDATVDALLDLFERAPGPDPVVFGSNERRDALAKQLASGLQPVPDDTVARALDARNRAIATRDQIGIATRRALDAEAQLSTIGLRTVRHPIAPALFEAEADLREADAIATAARETGGWWARRRARRAARDLRRLSGAPAGATLDDLLRALEEAHAVRTSRTMAATGGLDLTGNWTKLRALDDQAHDLSARWLALETRSSPRLRPSSLGAVAAVATALRSGRAARREQLSRIDEDRLTKALPLWLGTLPDIDDLLPPTPGLFDLVVLDEASSIDQPLAAPALLRGKRAVIVGDPNQLRHVSFLSDEQQQEVLARYELDVVAPAIAAKLDVRRNSAFDVAASVAPVLVLDEHFRSDPHLVEFVAHRVYAGVVHVATRSPWTAGRDCIDIVRVDGDRDGEDVVRGEVDWVIQHLRKLAHEGRRSVGVVTPFRAQADAIEAAVLEELPLQTIDAMDLRVDTVHGFQGNERERVIVSIGLGPSANATSWRFVDDPPLFTVMMTRARRHLTVVLSADPPEGLLADYVAQADSPPGRPFPSGPIPAWADALAEDLESAGLTVTRAYPTGRHAVDLCIGEGAHSVAVVCSVHPEGSAAHIRRHLALVRAGWTVYEAFPSRWEDRRGELAVELIRRVRDTST